MWLNFLETFWSFGCCFYDLLDGISSRFNLEKLFSVFEAGSFWVLYLSESWYPIINGISFLVGRNRHYSLSCAPVGTVSFNTSQYFSLQPPKVPSHTFWSPLLKVQWRASVDLWSSLCAAFWSLVPCPKNTRCFSLPWPSTPLPQLRSLPGFNRVPIPPGHFPEILSMRSPGTIGGFTACFSSLRDHSLSLPDVHCLKHYCFIYLVGFWLVSGGRITWTLIQLPQS